MADWNPAWGDLERLATQVAQAPYAGTKAHCPWPAVAPLAQTILRSRAAAFLQDTIPVLIQHGWTPPKDTL